MASSILLVSVLLVVACVADGQSTTSQNSHCSYTFRVPEGDCGKTPADDQLLKNSVVALQAQMKLLADDNVKLRQEIATIKTDAVGGSSRSAVNLKQCSRRDLNEAKEHGLIMSCAFVKKRGDSVLRLVWNGDLRLINGGPKPSSCRRWFFTINGLECSEPKTIDTVIHVRTSITNVHRTAYVEGYCRDIPAGHLNVAWNIGDCISQGHNVGDSYTGWSATVRIIVEEVDVEDADTVIV